jgi:pyrroline-5-carboxylate reductase
MKILFIGVGNMGGAVLEGLLGTQSTMIREVQILGSSPESSKKTALQYGVTAAAGLKEGLEWAQCVILGVKPQVFHHLAEQIKEHSGSRKIFISLMAGITLAHLQEHIGSQHRFIRTMPNLPMTVGKGTTTVASNGLTSEEMSLTRKLFEAVSLVLFLPESQINAATAVAGSGPAWVFEMAEAWIRAGVHEGLPRQVAQDLVYATLEGSAHLLKKSSKSPSDLCAQVCSPGGTTIRGVQALEAGAFKSTVMNAVFAAHNRAKELGS